MASVAAAGPRSNVMAVLATMDSLYLSLTVRLLKLNVYSERISMHLTQYGK
jgi:hypothetical protein